MPKTPQDKSLFLPPFNNPPMLKSILTMQVTYMYPRAKFPSSQVHIVTDHQHEHELRCLWPPSRPKAHFKVVLPYEPRTVRFPWLFWMQDGDLVVPTLATTMLKTDNTETIDFSELS